jgi:hypothetical protein
MGDCSPQEETLEHRSNSGDAGMPRVDDDGLWLHGENADEREPGEIERLGANLKMSHVANEGAEITGATNVVNARQRPWNSSGPLVEFHGRVRRAREFS